MRKSASCWHPGPATSAGMQYNQAKDAAALKEMMSRIQPDVVLLDYKMPDATGLDLLPIIKKEWPEVEVIMLTGHATYDVAVEATTRGAFHFQEKPFDPESLLNLIKRALEIRSLREALSMNGNAIFQCDIMKNVVRTIRRVAPSDVSILITGESGTGKEVIADLIHTASARASGPLIKINCAALPRELIESELFGSVKGAFTGAHTDREGLFRQAEGGTLLLDELSEMPIDTQSKLLRVLQEKEVRPVGGRTSYKTDCRIIAATNRKPEEAIRDGKLREDLFYRISAVSVHLPPLRERRDDILPLATAFLKRFAAQANRDISGFSPEAAERLLRAFRLAGKRSPIGERGAARGVVVRGQAGGGRGFVHHFGKQRDLNPAAIRASPCWKAFERNLRSCRCLKRPAATNWKLPSV